MKDEYLKNVFKLDENTLLYKYLSENFHNFTLAEYIDYLKENEGNLIALCHLNKFGQKIEFTYKDLSLKSSQMANYLRKKGVKKGDVVALVLRNNYEFFISILAIQKLGSIALPLFYTNKKDQYESIFRRANVKCVIAEDYEIKQSKNNSCFTLNEINKALNKDIIKLCTHPRSDYAKSYQNLQEFETESNSFENEKVKITDLGYLFATSGTTGEPKLVMHNYGFALSHYFTGLWYGVSKGKKHLTVCDSGWAMSSWNMSAVLLHQGTIFVNDYDRFNAEDILKDMDKEGVSTLCAPRSILMLFIGCLEKNNKFFKGKLDGIASAGEPLSDDDRELVNSYFGVNLKEGYGMTEISLPLYEDEYGKKIVSPLYSDIIIDKKNNEDIGEIVIKGGKLGLLMGYLDKKNKYILYRKPPILNGKIIWHTSDMGHVDKKGNIICDGRYGCIVKINDCLVNKNEVEKIIKTHPMVLNCSVESKQDEISGNSLTATIELKDSTYEITDDEIKGYVKSKLPDYCRPKNVVFGEIPKTQGGKIIKKDNVPAPDKCLILCRKKAYN